MKLLGVCLFLLFLPFVSLFSAQGVEYRCEKIPNSYFTIFTGYQSVHIIEIDPSLCELKPIKALDNGALASINGGYFSIGGLLDGKASGALKIHEWIALPQKPRGCIGWSRGDQIPKMDRLNVKLTAHYNLSQLAINGLNRTRKEGEMILFTPYFNRTTLTTPDGEEVIVTNGTVASVVKGGSTKIPENGYVLSIQEKHPLFNTFMVGMPLTFSTEVEPLLAGTSAEEWASLDYVVGGVPLLIHQNQQVIDFESEQITSPSFLSNKQARSAVGVLPNGHWIFVVVDHTGRHDGMTMSELSNFMAKLGCVYALNLDGGENSIMVFEGGSKKISPSR